MSATWSEAKAKVSHRLAMYLRVDSFRLLNKTPMVSFTFDDIPKSAATTGARLLDEHGARGTFYVSGGVVGSSSPNWEMTDADNILALHARGHEIGCHTFSHIWLPSDDCESRTAVGAQKGRGSIGAVLARSRKLRPVEQLV